MTPPIFKTAAALALIVPLAGFAADARAQEWKPTQTMQMIVASGAGTAYDVMARGMSKHWEKYFGVKLVVQNIAAAGGSLGFDRVATSKPDGHTIGFMSRSPYIGEMMKKSFAWNLSDVPMILGADTPPYAVATGTKSPFKAWDDVRKAKTRIKIGIAGQLATDIVVIKDLLERKVEVTSASFGGTNQIVTAIQAGDVDVWTTVASQTLLDPVKAGHVRPLFTLATTRYSELPDTPTYLELGMPEEYKNVGAIRLWFAPIGTPQAIVDETAKRMTALLDDPELKDWNKTNGFVEALMSGAAAKATQDGLYKIIKDNDDIYQKYGG